MIKLKRTGDSHKVKIGILFILNKILKKNPNKNEIKKALNENDIKSLAKLTNNRNKLIRKYTTEFLYHISDTRAIKYNLQNIERTSDKSIKYNSVLIIQGAYDNLTHEGNKQQIKNRLNSQKDQFDLKSREIIDNLP